MKAAFKGSGGPAGYVQKIIGVEGEVNSRGNTGGDVVNSKGKKNTAEDATLRNALFQGKITGVRGMTSDSHRSVGQEGLNEKGEVAAKMKGEEFKEDAVSPGRIVCVLEVEKSC